MEKFFIEHFGLGWSLFAIPVFSGVVMSFVVIAIDTLTTDAFKGRWMLLGASFVVGAGLVVGFPTVCATLFDKIIVTFLNVLFALTFYHLKGKELVEFIIIKVFGKVQKKVE